MPTRDMPRSTQGRAAIASWSAVVVALVGAILLLHSLGDRSGFDIAWSDLPAWLSGSSTEQAALATARILALGAAYSIALATAVDMAARLAGLPALARSVEWATLPPVRRLAERVAAVAIGTASLVAPSVAVVGMPQGVPVAAAAPISHTAEVHAFEVPSFAISSFEIRVPDSRTAAASAEPVAVGDARPQPTVAIPPPEVAGGVGSVLPITLDHHGDPEPSPAADAVQSGPATTAVGGPPLRFLVPATAPGAASRPTGNGAGTPTVEAPPATPAQDTVRPSVAPASVGDHVVTVGDHLWGISVERLTAALGRAPSPTETSGYWSEMVAANRSTLRSGDPDLIFPGEIVTCPPVTSEP